MQPFDAYPKGGRDLFHKRPGYITRTQDGPVFMQKTGQTKCAYCYADFSKSYDTWVTMVLDHVVPVNICKKLSIPLEWQEDFSNMVLSCATCNGFCNRYSDSEEIVHPLSLAAFYDYRDRIFTDRYKQIAARHIEERTFFDTNPWLSRKLDG